MRHQHIAGSLLLVTLAGSITTASAQGLRRTHAIELTMSAGYFQPTGTSGQVGSLALTRRPAWAATTILSFNAPNGKITGELSGGYAAERVRQGTSGSRGTHMFFGTARVMLGRNPRQSGVSYLVGGGLSVVTRKKSVLDSSVGATDLGGTLSAMIRIPIDGQVGFRIDAQDLIYNADYGQGKKMRNDIVMSAGMSIAW